MGKRIRPVQVPKVRGRTKITHADGSVDYERVNIKKARRIVTDAHKESGRQGYDP